MNDVLIHCSINPIFGWVLSYRAKESYLGLPWLAEGKCTFAGCDSFCTLTE